jgi:hypothetical protein
VLLALGGVFGLMWSGFQICEKLHCPNRIAEIRHKLQEDRRDGLPEPNERTVEIYCTVDSSRCTGFFSTGFPEAHRIRLLYLENPRSCAQAIFTVYGNASDDFLVSREFRCSDGIEERAERQILDLTGDAELPVTAYKIVVESKVFAGFPVLLTPAGGKGWKVNVRILEYRDA